MDSPSPIFRPRPVDRQPIFNAPPGTVFLCATIVLAHLARVLLPYSLQHALIERFAFVPAAFLAQFGPGAEGLSAGELISLLSYALLHGDAMHLFLNVGLLLAFGSLIERRIGCARMLVVFVVSCILAALVQAFAVGSVAVAVIGASGGVYGLLGAAVPFLFRGGSNALTFIAVVMGINVLVAFVGVEVFGDGAGIAWQAHIGGFFAGLIAMRLLMPGPLLRRG